jgi:hypothetical protein
MTIKNLLAMQLMHFKKFQSNGPAYSRTAESDSMKRCFGFDNSTVATALMFFVAVTMSFAIHARPSYIYYCPRTNLYLTDRPTQTAYYFEGDKNGAAFPRNIEEYWLNSSYIGTGFIDYDDACTTSEFFCAQVQLKRMDETTINFTMFLPKYIEVGKSYSLKGVNAIASPVGDPYINRGWSKNQVQVTLWQLIGGVETPIKLTVEMGRGVVFWDGLDFWSGQYGIGETCFLQSNKGLFPDVKIKAKFPYPSGNRIREG